LSSRCSETKSHYVKKRKRTFNLAFLLIFSFFVQIGLSLMRIRLLTKEGAAKALSPLTPWFSRTALFFTAFG